VAEMWQIIDNVVYKNINFIRIAYRFDLFCAYFLMLAHLINAAGFVSKIMYFATEDNILIINTQFKLRNRKKKIYFIKANANLVYFHLEI
jgi:hypothetical protein